MSNSLDIVTLSSWWGVGGGGVESFPSQTQLLCHRWVEVLTIDWDIEKSPARCNISYRSQCILWFCKLVKYNHLNQIRTLMVFKHAVFPMFKFSLNSSWIITHDRLFSSPHVLMETCHVGLYSSPLICICVTLHSNMNFQ